MADDTDIFEGIFEPPKASGADTLGKGIIREATRLGVSPMSLATAISYETKGTFNPDIWSDQPDKFGNKHFGLIQFGPEEMKKYGVKPGMSTDEQMQKVGDYLLDRGVKPGMGLKDIYSTINAGKPGLYEASDRPGRTVASHVAEMGMHEGNAKALLSGMIKDPSATPSDFEGLLDSVPSVPDVEKSANSGPMMTNADKWGTGTDLINKLLLGGGKPLMAAAQGIKAKMAGGDFGDTYKQANDIYSDAQAQWAAANPGKDIGNFLLGALPSTMLAVGATRGKAEPLIAEGLTSMSPTLGPKIAAAIGGTAGKDMPGIAGLATRFGSRALEGLIEGGFSGGVQSGLTNQNFGEDVASGSIIGAVANPLLRTVLPSVKNYLQGMVTPANAKLFQVAKTLGIDLKGPQLSGNPAIREAGKKAGALGDEDQLVQYTRAAGKEMGENTDSLTPEVMKQIENRLDNGFSMAGSNSGDMGDKMFQQKLVQLRTKALQEAGGNPKNATYETINNFIGQLGRMAQAGHLDGDVYKVWRRSDSAIGRQLIKSTDSSLRYFGGQIMGALDDAFEREAIKRGAPEDIAEMKTLRKQWGAMKQIEPVVEKSGPSGLIDPQRARTWVGSNNQNLSDLGEIGQLLPRTTAQGSAKIPGEKLKESISNLTKLGLATMAGGAGGIAAGGTEHIPEALNMLTSSTGGALGVLGAAGIGATRFAVNKYIESLMHDPKYARVLAQQGLGRFGHMPIGPALIDAITSGPVYGVTGNNIANGP